MLDLEEVKPDVSLLAGRYTLLDHERTLQRVMPAAEKHNKIIAKVEKIKNIADRYQSSIKAAALQFSLANPAVAAVIPGAILPE